MAWKRNHKYEYNVDVRTFFISSPESNDKWSGIVYRGRLIIQPQSNDLLVGEFSRFEYAEVKDCDYNANDFEYNEKLDMNKPFRIHLENGVIGKLSVNPSMTQYESDTLKVILSSFQVNTNAENLVQEILINHQLMSIIVLCTR